MNSLIETLTAEEVAQIVEAGSAATAVAESIAIAIVVVSIVVVSVCFIMIRMIKGA